MWLFVDLFFTLCSPFAPGARTEWDALGIPADVWLSRVEAEEMCIRRELGLLFDTPEELMRDVLRRMSARRSFARWTRCMTPDAASAWSATPT